MILEYILIEVIIVLFKEVGVIMFFIGFGENV